MALYVAFDIAAFEMALEVGVETALRGGLWHPKDHTSKTL